MKKILLFGGKIKASFNMLLGSIADQFTFTRASAGTYVDVNGTIQTAVEYDELVTNRTFDSNIDGWIAARASVLSWDNGTLKTTAGSSGFGGANFLLKTDAVVGEVYNFSFDYVSGGGTAETCYLIFAQTSTQGNRSFTSPNYKTTGYGTYTGQVTALIKVIKGV